MRVPSFVKTNDDWDLQIVASLWRLHSSVTCHCSTARHAALQCWTLVTVATLPLVVTMNAAAVDGGGWSAVRGCARPLVLSARNTRTLITVFTGTSWGPLALVGRMSWHRAQSSPVDSFFSKLGASHWSIRTWAILYWFHTGPVWAGQVPKLLTRQNDRK